MIRRRSFLKSLGMGGTGLFVSFGSRHWLASAAIPGGTLDPALIPKYQMALVVPPAMPQLTKSGQGGGQDLDYYQIAVREFRQQILPPSLPKTTVWSYGSANDPGSFHAPAFTVEARWRRPVRVKWINDLKEPFTGRFLPHLLAVDQTLHWANPPGPRDMRGTSQLPYTGPVPIVTHVHEAHTSQESDGYPEAWYLPAATDIPDYVQYRTGTFYDQFKLSSPLGALWEPGTAVFEYPNDQRACALWYHDHSLGMTRLNVYAGPAGFYLLRGGPDDMVGGTLPGPAPAPGDPPGVKYYEIPIAIQDRSFNRDGSLFYPADRAFFEGLKPNQLRIPFIPEYACGGPSDVPPIWNPEFFGNTMMVNGRTWPYLEVERRRYRFRFLNGCNARFLILKFSNNLPLWQIGNEGGFLPEPVMLQQLLMAPAERADVIVDFTDLPAGTRIILRNLGPDEPFGGGVPDDDFDSADPDTTGQVMQFRVVSPTGSDPSTHPEDLKLPPVSGLGAANNTRRLSLNEEESRTVLVKTLPSGNIQLDCDGGEPFGPTAALLGTLQPSGAGNPLPWEDPITENPSFNSTEIWEIYNFTEDAHPIHLHMVQFEVVNRQAIQTNGIPGAIYPPEAWERGFKDTVIAYPEQVTRIKAKFDIQGRFVWHCHILEHEDNEMMRPYQVGP